MTTGERIKNRRKEMGWNAEKLAEEIGVSAQTVYRWEKGQIENMGVDKLSLIASSLRVSPAYLLGASETEEKPLVNNDERLTALLERARDEDRMLFSLATSARVEDVQLAIEMLRRLREGEKQ